MVSSAIQQKKSVFVTVGSTQFDKLVANVLLGTALHAFIQKGYTHLAIQYGNSPLPLHEGRVFQGLQIETFKYTDRIEEYVEEADLIISHAGAGSILTALRANKNLLVVVNEDLMDNHQAELAHTLQGKGYLVVSRPSDIASSVSTFSPSSLVAFPPPTTEKFIQVLDEEMGF